jgi:peroxygenase
MAQEPTPAPEQKATALQKHVQFFDADGDGRVTWSETYRGFRSLGFNFVASVFAACVINFSMAFATSDSWFVPRL